MAGYKEIKGFQVQTRTTDPTPYAQALADNPYAGAWSSGANLNGTRYALAGTGASNSAALVFGGYPNGSTGATEQYNGSSWTEVNDLNTARGYLDGAGTYTAALAFAGLAPPSPGEGETETWNGSSWTEVNDVNSARYNGAGDGTQTSALFFGGTGVSALNESWDGTNWTEVGDLNTAREGLAAAGTSNTASLAFGGGSPNKTETESWNGSSWTEVNDLNTARRNLGGTGTTTAALAYGGRPPNPGFTQTESWDGTSWTEVNDLATARGDGASAGSSTSALFAGGYDGATPFENATEEWSFSGLDPSTTPAADYADAITGDFYYNSTTGQFKTVNDGGAPIGTWASGGNMNSGRAYHGAAGTQTAALAISGAPTPPFTYVANVENYNGSTWTEIADVNGARHEASGFGTTTAAIYAAGYGPNSLTPTERTDKVESWNGSSWTEVAETNEIKNIMGSGGSSTAGIIYGGALAPQPAPVATANVEYWNGSGWSEQTNMNQARSYLAGFGTQTSITAAGGHIGTSGTNLQNVVETWDGTSWTEVSEINNSRAQYASSGTSSPNGLIFTGSTGPASGVNNCEHWNGSSWTEINDVSTAVRTAGRGPVGTSTSALKFGGFANPATTASTEEFTAEDFQIKTVTTS